MCSYHHQSLRVLHREEKPEASGGAHVAHEDVTQFRPQPSPELVDRGLCTGFYSDGCPWKVRELPLKMPVAVSKATTKMQWSTKYYTQDHMAQRPSLSSSIICLSRLCFFSACSWLMSTRTLIFITSQWSVHRGLGCLHLGVLFFAN